MPTWTNADGLLVKTGTDEGVSAHTAGEYATAGAARVVEIEIDLTKLTETETILNDVVLFPKGAMIESCQVVCEVGAVGGVAVDVGFIRSDRTTELDYDGLLAAFPTASMAFLHANLNLSRGSSNTGALFSQVLSNSCLISASRTTSAAFTAGRVKLRISYVPAALTVN